MRISSALLTPTLAIGVSLPPSVGTADTVCKQALLPVS